MTQAWMASRSFSKAAIGSMLHSPDRMDTVQGILYGSRLLAHPIHLILKLTGIR
jgi:hypothetical protein